MARLVLPYGFYTAGNVGDESTLCGFAQLLRALPWPTHAVPVSCQRPDLLPRAEPSFRYVSSRRRNLRRWWVERRGTAAAIVGATPIQDAAGPRALEPLAAIVERFARRRVPILFVGVGVERLLHEASRDLMRRVLIPSVAHWAPRSTRGREHLIAWGVPLDRITQTADLAWLLPAEDTALGQACLRMWGIDPSRPIIGVNIAGELFEQSPKLIDVLASALDRAVEFQGAQVLFFAHDVTEATAGDMQIAEAIVARMRHNGRARIVPNEYLTPRQFLSLVGCCDTSIGMRYHFCVFSALQGVPFLAIEHSDKVRDLCTDVGWGTVESSVALDAAVVSERLHALNVERRSHHAHLASVASRMRSSALSNNFAIRAHVVRQSPLMDPSLPA